MIKLIVGTKGSGKTKAMVDMINNATQTTTGNVVVIEKCMNLTYHIDYKARLIDMDEYKISGYDMLYGFISGVLAGNYDITELYVDGILKVGGRDYEALGKTLAAVDALAGENVKVIVTVSADEAELPDSVKKYLSKRPIWEAESVFDAGAGKFLAPVFDLCLTNADGLIILDRRP